MNAPNHPAVEKIALDRLTLSPRNARRTGGTNVADLVALIAAEGLLQNLVVIPDGDGFGVIAGGRRLRALQQLAKQGALPASLSDGIPCLVADASRATTISLTENTREQMHPADQCEVFKALLADESEAEVAARFNVTVPYLRQRLKLANVAPKIIEAFRADKLKLGQVEAFALSNDHAHQERVLKSLGNDADPGQIRRRLTQGQVEADDSRVALIGGLQAYEKAGGPVHRDMFSDAAYVTDVKLLDKLVDQRFKDEKQKLIDAGWSWVQAGPDLRDHHFNKASSPDKGKHGAIVCCDYNGRLKTVTGLLKQGERDKGGNKGKGKKGEPKDRSKLSFPQTQLLQAERTAALRLKLATDHRFGLAALAATLLVKLLRGPEFHDRVSDYENSADDSVRIGSAMDFRDRAPFAIREALDTHASSKEVQAKIAAFGKRIPKKTSIFAWLLQEPLLTTHEALALASGAAVMTVQPVAGDEDPGASFAGSAALDMGALWKVTPEWLAAQPSAFIVAAVAEYRGKNAADQVARAKGKAGVVGAAAPLLAGWLPKPLRGPTYAVKAAGEPPIAVVGEAPVRTKLLTPKKKGAPAKKAAAEPAPKAKKTAKKTVRKTVPRKPAKKAARK